MPTARSGLGIAVVDGKIYVIVDGINYKYDQSTNLWTTKTPLPTGVDYTRLRLLTTKSTLWRVQLKLHLIKFMTKKRIYGFMVPQFRPLVMV
jgi:hypothetical protein